MLMDSSGISVADLSRGGQISPQTIRRGRRKKKSGKDLRNTERARFSEIHSRLSVLEGCIMNNSLGSLDSEVSNATNNNQPSKFFTMVSSLEGRITELEGLLAHSNVTETSTVEMIEQGCDDDTMLDFSESASIDDHLKLDIHMMRKLPSDTYSFIIVGSAGYKPFVIGLAVFAFQVIIYSLLLLSISVTDDNGNPIPANVVQGVRITQLIAIVIAVITQNDIRTGLNMMHDGYEKQSIQEVFPHVRKWKWVLSITARISEGVLGLVVSFILIVTAETVVDMLLNFTAIEFVSHLDEVCYFMVHEGYAGKKTTSLAHAISSTAYRCRDQGKGGAFSSYLFRNLLFVVIFVGMCAGWIQVGYEQSEGKFLCSSILVQFDDSFVPKLGTFSGLYDVESAGASIFSPKRVRYVERVSKKTMFAYCEEQNIWTFSVQRKDGTIDACDWKARSSETKGFDLTETAASQWFVRNSEFREVTMDNFYLSCYDCNQMVDECGGRGICKDAVCSCDKGWYGLRCEFLDPCPTLQFDHRFGAFQGNHPWSTTFHRFRLDEDTPVDVYKRPVYINEYSDGLFDIILFIGKRWVATYSPLLPLTRVQGEGGLSAKELANFFLDDDFHAFWSDLSFAVMSDPVDLGTPQDQDTPVGIAWHSIHDSSNQGDLLLATSETLSSVLLCRMCNNSTNKCMYDGVCVDGTCHCSIGSSGTLCQDPPVGNGHCDMYYNKLEFEYDGGDCCESTCVSSEEFTCGADGFSNFGYFSCRKPWEGWRLNGESVSGTYGSVFGYAIALSDSGKILAVAGPRLGHVRIFDKDGSKWVQRGNQIEGSSHIFFGNSIAMSTGPLELVNNPTSMAPLVLAVSTTYTKTGYIYVYECNIFECTQERTELVAFESNNLMKLALDISSDGDRMAVGVAPLPNEYYSNFRSSSVILLERVLSSTTWIRREILHSFYFGGAEGVYSVSLSANGQMLAIASYTTSRSIGGGSQTIQKDIKRVFTYIGGDWKQRGSSITNYNPDRSMLFNMQGRSMALSKTGDVLASGLWATEDKRQAVRMVKWDEFASDWTQYGSMIHCDVDRDIQGWSVTLSADGSVLAITSADRNEEDSVTPGVELNGTVCVFHWNGTEWDSQPGGEIPGGHSSAVDLSADGTNLAVGLPFYDLSRTGLTSVYEFPKHQRTNGTSLFRLSLTTDDHPESTTWEVFSNDSGQTILEGGPYDELILLSTYVEEAIVVTDGCLIFTLYDRLDLNEALAPDGIKPPAGYEIFMDGKGVAKGKVDDAVERVYIGSCLKCPAGNLFQVLIQTCIPVGWELVDKSSGEILAANNSVLEYHDYKVANDCSFANQITHWEDLCLSPHDCVEFSLKTNPLDKPMDSSDDRFSPSLSSYNLLYRLFMDNEEIAGDKIIVRDGRNEINMESVETVQLGNCGR